MGLVDELKKLPKVELRKELDGLAELLRINNAVLIANPESEIWRFAKDIQAHILHKKGYDIPLEEVRIKHFNNREFRPQVMTNVRKRDVYFIQDSTEDPTTWWVQLELMDDLLHRASAESITFVLPDYLWGRQDSKDRPHVPVSARKLAQSLVHVDRVIAMDIHARQIQGFFDCPIDTLQSFPTLIKYLQSPATGIKNPADWIVSSTDAGSAAMAEIYYNLLGCYDIVTASKKRNKEGKVVRILISGDVSRKNVLVPDDMDDSCGTKVSVGKELKKRGALELVSVSSHGLYTNPDEFREMKKVYKRIITTDTHYHPGLKSRSVEIVPISSTFGEAIYNAQVGDSISKLFEINNNGK